MSLPTILEDALFATWQFPAAEAQRVKHLREHPEEYTAQVVERKTRVLKRHEVSVPTLSEMEEFQGLCGFTQKPGEDPAWYVTQDDAEAVGVEPVWSNSHPWHMDHGDREKWLHGLYVWDLSKHDEFRVDWFVLNVQIYEADESLDAILTAATELLKDYNAGFDYHDDVGELHAAMQHSGIDIDQIVEHEIAKQGTRRTLAALLEDHGLRGCQIRQSYDAGVYTVVLPRDPQIWVKAMQSMPSHVGEAEIQYVFDELPGQRKTITPPTDIRAIFHTLWTKAVHQQHYDKKEWNAFRSIASAKFGVEL